MGDISPPVNHSKHAFFARFSGSTTLSLVALLSTFTFIAQVTSFRVAFGGSLFNRRLALKNNSNPGKDDSTQQGCVDAILTISEGASQNQVDWEVTDSQGTTIESLPFEVNTQASAQSSFGLGCLNPSECYTLTILDSSVEGTYSIEFGGETRILTNGQYSRGESLTFGEGTCLSPTRAPPVPTAAPALAPTAAPDPAPISDSVPAPSAAPVPTPTDPSPNTDPAPASAPVPAPIAVPVAAPTAAPVATPTTAPVPAQTAAPTGKLPCVDVTLIFDADAFPNEVDWSVTDSQGNIVASLPSTPGSLTRSSFNLGCLDPVDCYTFTILDSAGDGICCGYGKGSYRITFGGSTAVESDGQYGFGESVTFGRGQCPLPTPPPNDGSFSILLVDMTPGGAPLAYTQAFTDAKNRWEEIITNDLPDVSASNTDWFRGRFSSSYTQPIDDLVIGYSVGYIDGLYGTLGKADCTAGFGFRCYAGYMQFETADLNTYAIEDAKAIILHEMGHVLGAVGNAGKCASACDLRESYLYPDTCPNAIREYAALSTGTPLLFENTGGGPTECFHWKEENFLGSSSELMTGFFEADRYQPISRVTLGALDDIGVYTINYDAADEWPFVPGTNGRSERQVLQTQSNFYLPSLMEDSSKEKKKRRERQLLDP